MTSLALEDFVNSEKEAPDTVQQLKAGKKKLQKLFVDTSNGSFFLRHLLIRKKPKNFHEDNWRAKLARILHGDKLHTTMNILLILDLSILIVSMQLELYYLDSQIESYETACSDHAHSLEHYGTSLLHETEENLKWLSIGILGIFIFENLCVLISEGAEYFSTPMHAVDLIVVIVSLYFELAANTFAATILLLSRTWRFIRMVHGIIEITEEEEEDDDDDDEKENDKKNQAKDPN